ncbi:Protein kinase superfamily protein [Prunus dulcis]|uniref:Protein kinase superfamily protein n=1 Tax=Prunus dulcis TaxID=3755 RepID=A0A5H2YGL3_PRUDU|nr:Protein kinase superfamily protein [Prunus dulcis]
MQANCSSEHKLNGVFFKRYVPTYAHRRQGLPPLQTSCSSEHNLNGVFFKPYVPDIRAQTSCSSSTNSMESFSSAMSPTYAYRRQALSSLETSCSLEHKLNGVIFMRYVPDIHTGDEPSLHCRQATS